MTKKLLIADDSITIQKVIEMTFEGENFEIIPADNADSALEKALQIIPDIVLVDITIPPSNGFDLTKKIKESPSLKNVPVILLTSDFEDLDMERFEESLADDHLAKPFKSNELIDKVKSFSEPGFIRAEEPQADSMESSTWLDDDLVFTSEANQDNEAMPMELTNGPVKDMGDIGQLDASMPGPDVIKSERLEEPGVELPKGFDLKAPGAEKTGGVSEEFDFSELGEEDRAVIVKPGEKEPEEFEPNQFPGEVDFRLPEEKEQEGAPDEEKVEELTIDEEELSVLSIDEDELPTFSMEGAGATDEPSIDSPSIEEEPEVEPTLEQGEDKTFAMDDEDQDSLSLELEEPQEVSLEEPQEVSLEEPGTLTEEVVPSATDELDLSPLEIEDGVSLDQEEPGVSLEKEEEESISLYEDESEDISLEEPEAMAVEDSLGEEAEPISLDEEEEDLVEPVAAFSETFEDSEELVVDISADSKPGPGDEAHEEDLELEEEDDDEDEVITVDDDELEDLSEELEYESSQEADLEAPGEKETTVAAEDIESFEALDDRMNVNLDLIDADATDISVKLDEKWVDAEEEVISFSSDIGFGEEIEEESEPCAPQELEEVEAESHEQGLQAPEISSDLDKAITGLEKSDETPQEKEEEEDLGAAIEKSMELLDSLDLQAVEEEYEEDEPMEVCEAVEGEKEIDLNEEYLKEEEPLLTGQEEPVDLSYGYYDAMQDKDLVGIEAELKGVPLKNETGEEAPDQEEAAEEAISGPVEHEGDAEKAVPDELKIGSGHPVDKIFPEIPDEAVALALEDVGEVKPEKENLVEEMAGEEYWAKEGEIEESPAKEDGSKELSQAVQSRLGSGLDKILEKSIRETIEKVIKEKLHTEAENLANRIISQSVDGIIKDILPQIRNNLPGDNQNPE